MPKRRDADPPPVYIDFACECGRQFRFVEGSVPTRLKCPACGRRHNISVPVESSPKPGVVATGNLELLSVPTGAGQPTWVMVAAAVALMIGVCIPTLVATPDWGSAVVRSNAIEAFTNSSKTFTDRLPIVVSLLAGAAMLVAAVVFSRASRGIAIALIGLALWVVLWRGTGGILRGLVSDLTTLMMLSGLFGLLLQPRQKLFATLAAVGAIGNLGVAVWELRSDGIFTEMLGAKSADKGPVVIGLFIAWLLVSLVILGVSTYLGVKNRYTPGRVRLILTLIVIGLVGQVLIDFAYVVHTLPNGTSPNRIVIIFVTGISHGFSLTLYPGMLTLLIPLGVSDALLHLNSRNLPVRDDGLGFPLDVRAR